MVSIAETRIGIERVVDSGFRGELEAWLRDGVRVWFGNRIFAVDEAVLLVNPSAILLSANPVRHGSHAGWQLFLRLRGG